MNRPHGYYRPGVSVLTVTDAPAAEALAHAARLLPFADEVVIVGRAGGPAQAPAERIRFVAVASQTSRAECFRLATEAAMHQWLLRLEVGETLQERSWKWLRRLMPHLAAAGSVAGGGAQEAPGAPIGLALRVAQGRSEARLWCTPWARSAFADSVVAEMAAGGAGLESPNLALEGAGEIPDVPALPIPPVPAPAAAPAVLVLGMHRSGTSLLARIANLLGVELGDRLYGVDTAARPDNPRGYWENMDAVTANNLLIEAATRQHTGWEWTFPVAGAPGLAGKATQEILDRTVQALRPSARWGFKDPRSSLMLGAWAPLLGPSAAVLCVRDPRAVAASIAKRDGLPMADGIRLWMAYNRVLLDSLEEQRIPTLVVHYERFLADIDGETLRLARFLGLEGKLDAETLAQVREFSDKSLAHHSFKAPLADELPRMLGGALEGEVEEIAAVYQALAEAAAGQGKARPAAAALTPVIDELCRAAQRASASRPAQADKQEAAPAEPSWSGESILDFGSVKVELLLPPALDARESTDGHFLLGKNKGMVDALLAEIEGLEVKRAFIVGVRKGGEVVLLNERLRPEKLVAIEPDQPDLPALERYIKAQDGRVAWYSHVLQTDHARLRQIFGQEFSTARLDLVVDNGTHLTKDTRETFQWVFPRLRPGGLYVIETWGWAHWPGDFWQKERGGEYFRDKPSMANLVLDLMVASASAPQIVQTVRVQANAVYVVRGWADIDRSFVLADLCLNRGEPLPRFGDVPPRGPRK